MIGLGLVVLVGVIVSLGKDYWDSRNRLEIDNTRKMVYAEKYKKWKSIQVYYSFLSVIYIVVQFLAYFAVRD